MKKVLVVLSLVLMLIGFSLKGADAVFIVEWGISQDDGLGGGQSLQNVFNAAGYGYINVTTDYIGYAVSDPDPFYFNFGIYPTQAVLIKEIAGYHGVNAIYWYSQDLSTQGLVFPGPVSPPATVTFSPVSPFGFYLTNPGGTFYTDRFLNPGSKPQALIYPDKYPNMYLVAFEDIRYGSADKDYQDSVFSVTLVPEPGTLLLLGGGLIGLGLYGRARARRRKERK